MSDVRPIASNSSPAVPFFETDLGDKLSRYTVGRISCLARLPIYALALLYQTLKTLVKIPIAFVATPLASLTGSHDFAAFTFSGVAKEGIMVGLLLEKTAKAAIGIIFAPPKKHASFSKSVQVIYDIVVKTPHLDAYASVGELASAVSKTDKDQRDLFIDSAGDESNYRPKPSTKPKLPKSGPQIELARDAQTGRFYPVSK